MKTIFKTSFVIMIAAIVILLSSCSKTSDPAPATLKFSTPNGTYAEDKGLISIPVTLSSAQGADVIVNYSWSSTDTTTYLGGDFSVTSPTSFTIKAGQTTGNLQVQIIDDTQIDKDDKINLLLTGINIGGVNLGTATEISFDLIITNNDVAPPSGQMQIDLVWHMAKTVNINDVNLDLYLQQNVVYNSGTGAITNIGTSLTSSKNTTGYETIFLKSTDKDQAYFLVINYATGSSTVTFVSTWNGFGHTDDAGSGKLAPSNSGFALFYGPFTKSGSTFGRTESPKFYFVDKALVKGF
jgi:hypothetical protein